MKKIIVFLVFVTICSNLFCQAIDSTKFNETPSSIYEVLKEMNNDSLMIYYDSRWNMVKPVCATKFRIASIDTLLFTFSGRFVDYYYSDSSKAVEGYYAKGKKEGFFKLYFPNGQVEQSGLYVNNHKQGIWEYFYENGYRKQNLNFLNDEVLIVDFWDEEGRKMVDSGNGSWFGFESATKDVKIAGAVVNGHKEGKWKKTITYLSRNMILNIEKYKEGKMVSGRLFSMLRGSESYKDSMYCYVEGELGFLNAEKFQISRCYPSNNGSAQNAKYPGGMDRFYSDLMDKLKQNSAYFKAEVDFVREIICIKTTIDTNGVMTNFKPISSIGIEDDVVDVLKQMRKWIPAKNNGIPREEVLYVRFVVKQ